MDPQVVDHYRARIAAMPTVRELHALARTITASHPADPDAAALEQRCWAIALELIARSRRHSGRARPHADEAVDWKERAAAR